MKKWSSCLLLLCISFVGCKGKESTDMAEMKGSRIYISGDGQSVGADIYIDDRKVGVMEKRVYSGPEPTKEEIQKQHEGQRRLGIVPTTPMRPGDVFAVGVGIEIVEGRRKPEHGVYDQIRVRNGKHELKSVKQGKVITKQIVVDGESYFYIDFAKMIIRGSD